KARRKLLDRPLRAARHLARDHFGGLFHLRRHGSPRRLARDGWHGEFSLRTPAPARESFSPGPRPSEDARHWQRGTQRAKETAPRRCPSLRQEASMPSSSALPSFPAERSGSLLTAPLVRILAVQMAFGLSYSAFLLLPK